MDGVEPGVGSERAVGETDSDAQPTLAHLVRTALRGQKLRAVDLARSIGISASYLSHVLRGKRQLNERKLRALADALGIPHGEVLAAAGFPPAADIPRVFLPDVVPRSVASPPIEVRVFFNLDFLDSMLLWWILNQQPLRTLGIVFRFERSIWRDTAADLAGYDGYGVAVCNKRIFPPLIRTRIEHWADIALYRGYALLGHLRDIPEAPPSLRLDSIDQARRAIRRIAHRHKRAAHSDHPRIVAMSQSTVERLRTPLSAKLLEQSWVQEVHAAGTAMAIFAGESADFFVGGLAQRLTLMREARFVEVLHGGNDPFLMSLVSLFATRRLMLERCDILHTIVNLWYDVVGKMRRRSNFRRAAVRDMALSSRHPAFEKVADEIFSNDDNEYMACADRPGALAASMFKVAARAASLAKTMTPRVFVGVIGHSLDSLS